MSPLFVPRKLAEVQNLSWVGLASQLQHNQQWTGGLGESPRALVVLLGSLAPDFVFMISA